MLGPHPFRLFVNPRAGAPGMVVLPRGGFMRAKAEITSWNGYAPTPLRDLPEIARDAGVAVLRLKDEAGRFGLGSFKALGGAYAIAARYRDSGATVCCATDGNHGRAVAWGAQRFGCRCVIFVHETVSQGRVDAIAAYGAEVRRVPGTYDDAVRAASRAAEEHGWFVVSDTSWPGYVDVPRDVMQGYRLMADEAADQWRGAPPTHVFIQGGVGGVAAAVAVQLRTRLQPTPALVVVEPDRAACLLASAELGELTAIPGDLDTLMAGLACGEPSLLAWQELDRAAAAFMAVPDGAAVAGMRLLADQGIVAGESGVAGLVGFLLAAADPASREELGLNGESRVLTFSTEGATDSVVYEQLVGRSVRFVTSQAPC
jgi:diaminopropionate ammonia-lyase